MRHPSNIMNTASITAQSRHPTIVHAARELRDFLERTTSLRVTCDNAGAAWQFTLVTDPSMKPATYAVRVTEDGGSAKVIMLTGSDESCVLHSVYELLETCGVFFDVMGPMLPEHLDLSALRPGMRTVAPFVKRRGIRQHINFAMDISSYPLAEALEYIRNLARMRMNHITFHSYSGQWFGYQQDGQFKHGGNFFYGTRFDLPREELFTRSIRNRAVYCIPEIEAVVDQPEVRSRMATDWLNAVIDESHRCGLHVQLSIEPPGKTHVEGVAICREVLRLYPSIDTLELITPECGNSERTLSAAELRPYLAELFGDGALDDRALMDSLKDNLHQLEGGLRNCARNIAIVKELRRAGADRMPAFAVGAYITCPDSLRILHSVMQRHTPDGVSLTFLPAHGARRAVANLRQMGFTRQSISRSMLYGWIEFDGNMYLQQNSVAGARQLIQFAKSLTGDAPVAGAALNHWRTAENRACIAYAARAFIEGPIEPADFYRKYAATFGIEDALLYANIMQELDDLDDLCREKMFNIGFCANGCWVRPGLRWTERWDNASIDAARRRYTAAATQLGACLQSAARPSGREIIRFLINRIECTILQLDCAQMMKGLRSFCDHQHPDRLSPEQKREVADTCDRAMDLTRRYLAKHAEAILDRGCEGTLISYFTTIPNYIAHIRAVFVEGEKKCTHFLPQFDEPPPPMIIGA